MPRTRLIIFALAALITGAPLSASLTYAWYIRSDHYRRNCADRLANYLKLPAEIDRVRPRSRSSREFNDITVYLPDRRDKALICRQAIVTMRPTALERDAYEIELVGGACELSTRTWLKEDYRRVLESGLRPSFHPDGPERVRFRGMDIGFAREEFHLNLHDASGAVSFPDEQTGHALLRCRNLNGSITPDPVTLTADFSPAEGGVRVDQLELKIPRLPLSILHLGELLRADIRHGDFDGDLTYSEPEHRRELNVRGSCFNIELSEWTQPFMPTPWHGTCAELELLECRIVDRVPVRIRFRGTLREVILGDILKAWDLGDVGGRFTLRVGEADLSGEGVHRLVASGQCADISLASLSRKLGWGEMTGSARLMIDDLSIVDNRLARLDARITIDESAASTRTISGKLIHEVVGRLLKFDLPPLLPESIEYTRCGVRFDVRDEQLHVFGTHGERDRTILTVRLFGREIPLVFEPADPIDLKPRLDELRGGVLPALSDRIQSLGRRDPPSSAPAR